MESSAPHPVANPTSPFWRTDLHELDELRTSAELPVQSDIVIIGGGYAGVSIAYHLVTQSPKDQPPPSITILEARQICSGATGRNGKSARVEVRVFTINVGGMVDIAFMVSGGHLRPNMFDAVATCIDQHGHGVEAAAELAEFEHCHIRAVKEAIVNENIDCDFNLTRCIDVYLNEEHAEWARSTYEALRARRIPYIEDIHFTSQKNAEGV